MPDAMLIAEMVRRYEVVGCACSVLEAQELGWMLTRAFGSLGLADPLKLRFTANRYGPHSEDLRDLLAELDGGCLRGHKPLACSGPGDELWLSPDHREKLAAYFAEDPGAKFLRAVEKADALIDGFQTPLGMEALATVDWLLTRERAEPTVAGIFDAIAKWPGPGAAERKRRVFNDRLLGAALARLATLEA